MGFQVFSPSEQVATHLREQLLKSRWTQELPGTPALAGKLDVDRKTVTAAIKLLEEEGLLESQGPGRPRKIVIPKQSASGCMNIRLIPYENADRQLPYLLKLAHQVRLLGHDFSVTDKSLTDLGMDTKRISGLVQRNSADAWLIFSASKAVLEWFATQETPAFAIFGRRRHVNIGSVGPDKLVAVRALVQRLIAFGHRRIVYLAREERRLPTPGTLEQQYLNELRSHGIEPGSYNLPDWQDNPDSFHQCLDRLFQLTPPTALIIDEAQFFVAAQQHLAGRNLIAPRDISLICCDTHPLFDWCQPKISHIKWNADPVVSHATHWISQLGRGKNDRKTSYTSAEFIEGGTIGPAKN